MSVSERLSSCSRPAAAADQKQAHTTLELILSFILPLTSYPQQNLALSIMSTPWTSSGLYLCLPSRAIINPQSVLSSLVHYHIPSKASFCKEFSSNSTVRLCLHLFFAGCFRAPLTRAEDNWVLQLEIVPTDLRGKSAFVFTPVNIQVCWWCLPQRVELIRPTGVRH